MTLVFRSPQEFKNWRTQNFQKSLGFVPTMGALHTGHEELLKRARNGNELCVLSVFVNPTQFNDPLDFKKYPLTWEADLKMAQDNKVDAIFYPRAPEMYPDNYKYKLTENSFSQLLDGAHRPGHFDGVLTVVLKLFNIVKPTRAYFGEKDFQQLTLIKGMVESLFMDIEIVNVPTVREADGLAKSSRNVRLTETERKKAFLIFKALTESTTAQEAQKFLTENGFKVDYVTDVENRRFAAAFLGEVRLIDNVQI